MTLPAIPWGAWWLIVWALALAAVVTWLVTRWLDVRFPPKVAA